MNLTAISRNVGYALLVSALFMLMSAGVALLDGHDSSFGPLLISFVITFIVGIFPFIFVRRTPAITLREGYLIIVLSWLLSFIFGMLPFALWGGPFTVANAWFESVSGFTTTGATILEDIEALPKGLVFWRCATHFIGGLGVVVFLLLIIPGSSPVRMRLTNMELSSLSKSAYASRSNRTVYIFASVYLGLFLAAFVTYMLAGMSAFDAVCHAFSVCATGGFSSRNLSIGAFDSRAIELLTMVFMFLSSIHFGLIFMTVVTRSLKPLNNPILKFYVCALCFFGIVEGLGIWSSGLGFSLKKSMWVGVFRTINVASTSGFAIVDNSGWPLRPDMLLLCMAVMCACAGSTSGGLKVDRVILFFKAVKCRVSRFLHPSSINEVRLGSRVMTDAEVYPHILYIALYFFIIGVSSVLVFCTGADALSSFSGSVASLANVGPGMGELGASGNYGALPSAAKFIFTLDMFLGRIELYPVLTVLGMLLSTGKR